MERYFRIKPGSMMKQRKERRKCGSIPRVDNIISLNIQVNNNDTPRNNKWIFSRPPEYAAHHESLSSLCTCIRRFSRT